jgi:hypothetical protein
MKKLAILLFFTAIALSSQARTIEPDIIINGRMNARMFDLLDKALQKHKKKDVFILVKSSGGYLEPSVAMIITMKKYQARGYMFTCLLRIAGSGAASFISNCDMVITYNNSIYAQHCAYYSNNKPLTTDYEKWLETYRLGAEAKRMGTTPNILQAVYRSCERGLLRLDGKEIYKAGLSDRHRNKNLRF